MRSFTPAAPAAQHHDVRTAPDRRTLDQRETRLRRRIAWTLTLCSLLGFVGTSWDIQWHAAVGRDTFLTPPHMLIYTAIGLSGLVALAFVLGQTVRYHRRAPALRPAGTTRVLWIFHAPLGAIMAGFGVLATVIAAPLDAVWHELYGIDVTIWAPFHVMGIVGSVIVGLGTLYLFANVFNRDAGTGRRSAEAGFVLRAALLLVVALFLSIPALEEAPYLRIGGATLALHPLIVAFLLTTVFAATARIIRRPGAVLLVGLCFSALRLLIGALVPWAVATMASLQGASYRASAPGFTVVTAAFPAWIIVACLLVEALGLLARRRLAGAPSGPPLALLAGALAGGAAAIIEPLWRRAALFDLLSPTSAALVVEQAQPAILLASALGAALVGVAGAAIGMGLGASLEATRE